MNGFLALHRKIRKSAVFNDLELYRLWTICLTEASHKEHEILVGRQAVTLQKGQFVTGRFDLHRMYNEGLKPKNFVSGKTVWRWLETLQKLENVTITSTNKFSIVTVVNWDLYQFNDQQIDQQVTNKRPTNDQQMTTNNNGNKGNKEKSRHKKAYDEDSVYFKISEYLLEQIRKMNPDVKKPDLQKWSDEVRLMIEVDKRPIEDVRELMRWMYTKDTFWKTVTLSTAKLRKNYDEINTKRLSNPIISQAQQKYTKPPEKIIATDADREHMKKIIEGQSAINAKNA